MRFLAISDIHGQVMPVLQLREREKNEYDAIVVAGDIGSAKIDEIGSILQTFECPVLYVFGNWDYDLAYDLDIGRTFHHLHLNPFKLEAFVFVGFSGLPANWGQNPFALALKDEVEGHYRPLLTSLKELKDAEATARARIDREHAERVSHLNLKSPDKRKKAYRSRVDKLLSQQHRELEFWRKPIRILEASKEYNAYTNATSSISHEALIANRRSLANCVRKAGAECSIVVTHERLTNTVSEFPRVPLFLFGHRHGFTNTTFKGSRFVNVSAIENQTGLFPSDSPGSYVIINKNKSGELVVTQRKINVD